VVYVWQLLRLRKSKEFRMQGSNYTGVANLQQAVMGSGLVRVVVIYTVLKGYLVAGFKVTSYRVQ